MNIPGITTLALAAALAAACTPVIAPSHDVAALQGRPAAVGVGSPAPHAGSTAARAERDDVAAPVGAEASAGPRVTIERMEGGDPALERAILRSFRERLKKCEGDGRVVRMRVESGRGGTRVDLSPGSALDRPSNACALRALSALESADAASWGSPSARSSGFSVLLRIEW